MVRRFWASTAVALVLILETAQGNSYGTGCTSGTCGVNAQCTTTTGGRPVCSCLAGHYGDPLAQCKRSECLDHVECADHLSCRDGRCVDPCAGVCGINAHCQTRNHVAVCSCPAGYKGDPFTSCRLMDPNEACHPTPCGSNTKCEVVNSVPTCSCLPTYVGSPLAGCRHECESNAECGAQEQCENFKCTSSCSKCGQGAKCNNVRNHRALCECPKGYIGDPYSSCRPECYGDSDCPSGKPACLYGTCANPCTNACGYRANCELRGTTPICSCPRDMTGDPFTSCRPFEKRDLCEPNPCGSNAQCTPGHDNTNRERPVCTCLPGHIGNALTSCQRGECQTDSECPNHKACVSYSCVDPCVGQCGAGAECNARNHIAVCTCPAGTKGDAIVSCYSVRGAPVARYNRYYNKKK